MKKIYTLIIAIFIGNIAKGQWQPTKGPYSGPVQSICFKGSDIYVGTENSGIYKSSNNGLTWETSNNGLNNHEGFKSFAVLGNNVFTLNNATKNHIYKTSNNGISWIQSDSGIPLPSSSLITNIESIAVSGTTLFASNSNGVFRSLDTGNTWHAVNNGIILSSNKNKIIACGSNIIAYDNSGYYNISNNNGNSWNQFNIGNILSLKVIDTIVYASVYNNTNTFKLYKLPYNSTNWVQLFTLPGLKNNCFLQNSYSAGFSLISDSILYLSICDGLFKLNTNNSLWVADTNSIPARTTFYTMERNDTNIYACTSGGIYRCSVNNPTWNLINEGINNTRITSLAISGNNIFAGTRHNGMFLSTNNGTTWNKINNGIINQNGSGGDISTIAIKGNDIYFRNNRSIYHSNNNGSSWTPLNNGIVYFTPIILKISGNNVFADNTYKDSLLYILSNNGLNWMCINNAIPTANQIRSFVSEDSIILVSTYNSVYLSINKGINWTSISTGFNPASITKMEISNTNLIIGTSNGVYLSTNMGLNWSIVNSGIPTYSQVYFLKKVDNNLYLAYSDSLFLSTNNGLNWNSITNGLPANTTITEVVAENNKIVASTYTGFYLFDYNTASWISISNSSINYPLATSSFSIKGNDLFIGMYYKGVWKRNLNLCTPPSTQSSSFNTAYVSPTSATIGWTRGNGDSVLVVAIKDSYYYPNNDPNENTIYTANSVFGYGSEIQVDNFVVYKSIGNTVQITGLTPNTRYGIAIYEFNSNNHCYKTPGLTGSFVTQNAICNPVAITLQPTLSQSTCVTTGNKFIKVAASGSTPLTYKWQYNDNGTWNNTYNGYPQGAIYTNESLDSLTVSGISITGSFQYRCIISNCNGVNSVTSNISTLIVNPIPSAAAAITGSSTVCQGQGNVTYSVPLIQNATSYIWSLPSNVLGASTSNSITVNYGSNALNGIISVKGNNQCGNGISSNKTISVNVLPDAAGIISGITTICQGQNSITYTTPAITNATSYSWTLPSGITGTSATNSITVNFGNYAVSGNITVKGINACGAGIPSSLFVNVNSLPSSSGLISGSTNVCKGQTNVFSVSPIANATSYIWTLPTGIAGTSDSNSINVYIGLTASNGNITVKGINSCGIGATSAIAIYVYQTPSAAGNITGQTNVCQGQNTIIYSVPSIANAAFYEWTLPTGVIGLSSIDTIYVDYSNTAISGHITVKGINSVCYGDSSSLPITVNLLPSTASLITGTTNVTAAQQNVQYSIPAIANATSYLWSLPNGATGTSTTNTITVNYSSSAVSGNITVKGVNLCGNGMESSLYITVNPFNPNCSAQFDLVADTTTPHHYFAVNNASGIPPLQYNWSWGDGSFSTTAYPTHTYSASGNYKICLTITDSVGCTTTYCDSSYLQKDPNAIISVQVIPQGSSGINSLLSDKIKIYPNPAKDNLIIELIESNISQNSTISIYNIQGQLCRQIISIQSKTEVDIKDLSTGLYFVKLNNEKESFVSRFVKE